MYRTVTPQKSKHLAFLSLPRTCIGNNREFLSFIEKLCLERVKEVDLPEDFSTPDDSHNGYPDFPMALTKEPIDNYWLREIQTDNLGMTATKTT